MISQNHNGYANTASEINKEILFEDLTSNEEPNFKKLRIVHFNDVYNIEGHINEPVAGVARFYTAMKLIQNDGPCINLFSGDVFSPSSCN